MPRPIAAAEPARAAAPRPSCTLVPSPDNAALPPPVAAAPEGLPVLPAVGLGVGVPVAVEDAGVGVDVPAGLLLVVYVEPFAGRVTQSAWTYVLLPVPPRPVAH